MAVTVDEFVAAMRLGGNPDGPYDISPEDREKAMAILYPAPEPVEEEKPAPKKSAAKK